MIVEIQYKAILIKVKFEHEYSVKIENLKKSMRKSLIDELESLEKISVSKCESKNITPQNKNVSINSTFNPLDLNKIQANNNSYKEEIQDLLLSEEKFCWRFFEINETEVPIEKKDEDYLKTKSTLINGMVVQIPIKLLLSRSFTNKTNIKSNLQVKLNNSNPIDDTSELIRYMTGAKEKIKVEEKDKKKKLSNLFNEDPDLILQTLMGLNSNTGDTRVAFIQDLLGVRASQSSSSSNANNTGGTDPRANFQNRIFQSILNIGGNRPPVISRPLPTIVPNQAKVQQLLEMGFAEDRARRALIMARNNLEAAVDIIANEQDIAFEDPNNGSQNNNDNIANNPDELDDQDDDEEIHIQEGDEEDI